MKSYVIILDITIEKFIEKIKCRSDIIIKTIISVFKDCCNKTFEYLKKDDIKIKGELKDDIIHIQVLMEYNVYLSKLGKYVEDQQKKILDDLKSTVRSKLKNIDWKKILK